MRSRISKLLISIAIAVGFSSSAIAINMQSGFDSGNLPASQVTTDCSHWTKNLSCANANQQSVDDVVDQMSSGGGGSVTTVAPLYGSATVGINYDNASLIAPSSILKVNWPNMTVATATGVNWSSFYPTSNPFNYQTSTQVSSSISASLSGYATQAWVNLQGFLTSVNWALGTTANMSGINWSNFVLLNGSYANPSWITAIPYSILSGTVPTWNQNTNGTASNLSGTPAIPNGTTATTQSQADGSTKLATTAYVDTGLGGKASTSQTMYIGTTSTAINRSSATQALTGITSVDNGTTGVTVVTSPTNKGGFFGATPIVQPTGNICTAMTNLGLVSSCTESGAVTSVSNSDGTLTISPTTGAVVASLALGHANTWTATQTFNTSVNIHGTNLLYFGNDVLSYITNSATTSGDIVVSSNSSANYTASGTYSVSYSGGYTIVTFTSGSGSFTPAFTGTVNVMALGGGGAGGFGYYAGGGGAGGYQANASYATNAGTTINLSVGAGGTPNSADGQLAVNANGGNTTFGTITSYGGGGGGNANGQVHSATISNGANGSSGGGAAALHTNVGGSATQGYAGGNSSSDDYGAGGGGGSTAVGGNGVGNTQYQGAGSGGAGTTNSITGTTVCYAGGGGGSAPNSTIVAPGGCANAGKGGTTGGSAAAATSATANSGSGGGGAITNVAGGAGGSGVVIVSFPTSTSASTSVETARFSQSGNFLVGVTTTSLTGAKNLEVAGTIQADTAISTSLIKNNGVTALTIDGSGNLAFPKSLTNTTSTTGIGWSVKSGTNTACNTTCGTSACVFGQDTAALSYAIVACTDSTADKCVCAGP